jgi:hypothetical protein
LAFLPTDIKPIGATLARVAGVSGLIAACSTSTPYTRRMALAPAR